MHFITRWRSSSLAAILSVVLAAACAPSAQPAATTAPAPTAAPAAKPTEAPKPAAASPATQPTPATAAKPAAAGGLTGTITIGAPLALSGAAAFAGTQNREGMELAMEEVNSSNFLGSAKLAVDFQDHALSQEQAVTIVRRFIEQDKVPAIVGMTSSPLTLAVVPIAQQAKVPFVVVESGVKGVIETGNYVFRTNLPQTSYAKLIVDELKKRGVKTTAILYDEGTPTIVDLYDRLNTLFKDADINVTARETFKASDTDFSATLTKIRQQNPDALGVLAVGPANVTIVNQARQGGFTKQIWGQAGMAGGTMANAGPVGNGVIFLTAFDPNVQYPSTQKFVQAYKAKFNKAPTQFGAEGYDGLWLLARGLKQANSADRDALRKGMEEVSQQGFDGAQGPLKFENRDIRAPGVVLEVKDGKEAPVS